jgi:TonB family protein
MADLKYDIEKYLKGEMTSAERNALERKALEDPFLADALEGATTIDVDELNTDLQLLQGKLQQRVDSTSAKVVPLWMWGARIAAGLLIVAIGTFLVFQLRDAGTGMDSRIAEHTEKELITPPPAESPVAASESPSDEAMPTGPAEKKADAIQRSTPQVEANDLIVLQDPKPTSPARAAEGEAEVIANNMAEHTPIIVADTVGVMPSGPTLAGTVNQKASGWTNPATTADNVTIITPRPVRDDSEKKQDSRAAGFLVPQHEPALSPDVRREVVTNMKAKATDNAYVITGKVTDADDGDGLPGVNVTIKGTNYGTVTDGEGNFKVTVDEASPSLLFTFIGMEDKEVKIEDAREVNVAMVDDMTQLSEIVVVGYGADKMEEEIPGRIEFASPTGGRIGFKKYLEANMRYPQQALVNDIEGKVTVQFTVQTSGDLSDFKVIRGIGYGCEEEVIRLIKNGPKWNPTRKSDEPVVGKVKVKVKFRLPNKD